MKQVTSVKPDNFMRLPWLNVCMMFDSPTSLVLSKSETCLSPIVANVYVHLTYRGHDFLTSMLSTYRLRRLHRQGLHLLNDWLMRVDCLICCILLRLSLSRTICTSFFCGNAYLGSENIIGKASASTASSLVQSDHRNFYRPPHPDH